MKRAYTVLEVLTVVSILFLLSILVCSGWIRSARSASQSVCLSNERQITAGMALYTQDFDGQFPRVDAGTGETLALRCWTVALRPYTTGFKRCPDCARPGALAQSWADSLTTGYALNDNLNAYHAYTKTASAQYIGQNETLVQYPSLTVEISEIRPCIISVTQPDVNSGNGEGSYCTRYIELIAFQPEGGRRHQSGANYSFVDGHTKWYLPDQLDTSINAEGNKPGFGL